MTCPQTSEADAAQLSLRCQPEADSDVDLTMALLLLCLQHSSATPSDDGRNHWTCQAKHGWFAGGVCLTIFQMSVQCNVQKVMASDQDLFFDTFVQSCWLKM